MVSEAAPPEPEVERVERPDGRYVLYFSWPEAANDETPIAAVDAEDAHE